MKGCKARGGACPFSGWGPGQRAGSGLVRCVGMMVILNVLWAALAEASRGGQRL